MIFQHTINDVLSGAKTQTSRIWKDDYFFPSDYCDKTVYSTLLSRKAWGNNKVRRLYHVGQILSAQPNRGAKGVAKIRILELAKRDVRDFTDEDIAREGFVDRLDFFITWMYMHSKPYLKLLANEMVTEEWWLDSMKVQVPELHTALVIRFELVLK
jgi:hypothetical protein